MKTRNMFILLIVNLLLLLVGPAFSATASAQSSQQRTALAAPAPFMYQPYYGTTPMKSRIVSYFDHDRPWYVTDNYFVRYDGYTSTGSASVYSCQTGVNCYDGHNGYDYNFYYEPVLSVAAGTVTRAGWYDPNNHMSAFGLYVGIDHGNTVLSLYGHLSMLNVAVGDKVGIQWQIGTSGTTGSSTGPHLHFSTFFLPYWNATDPNGWTGKFADPNTVPDYNLWLSQTGSTRAVPDLSSAGLAAYPGATVIDDGAKGWSSTGSWATATSSTDVNGGLHWTSTTNGVATATSKWQATTLHDGYYEIGAFVDDNHATSGWATYTISSADPNHTGVELQHSLEVDESRIGDSSWNHAQWVGLGTYYFRASQLSQVLLTNATGESGSQIAADGVEFMPVP